MIAGFAFQRAFKGNKNPSQTLKTETAGRHNQHFSSGYLKTIPIITETVSKFPFSHWISLSHFFNYVSLIMWKTFAILEARVVKKMRAINMNYNDGISGPIYLFLKCVFHL